MAAYHVHLSDRQVKLLVAALAAPGAPKPDPECGDEYLLHDMLRDLPQSEAEHPGCLHGLCL